MFWGIFYYNAGADGLAVLNLILPVYGVIYAIGSMIGIGSATRYGINRAKGENVDCYFLQSVGWSILCSIPFVLLGIFVPGKVLALLGADAGLVALGKTYIRIILMGAPFFMCNYTVTALCPLVTMSVCAAHYLGKKCHIGFRWKKLSQKHLISCCQLGVSAFVGEISSAVIALVFNYLILGIAGSIGVAAYGIVANMSIVGMCIFNGMAQGVQPLISECYGKGQSDYVKKLLCWGLNSIVILLLSKKKKPIKTKAYI